MAARRGQAAPLRRGEADDSGVVVLEVAHESGPASLLMTREVLDHYLVEEIIAALTEQGASARLASERRLRLTCWEGGGRIVIQPSA